MTAAYAFRLNPDVVICRPTGPGARRDRPGGRRGAARDRPEAAAPGSPHHQHNSASSNRAEEHMQANARQGEGKLRVDSWILSAVTVGCMDLISY